MQVTIDIPEPKYGELALEAERLKTTVQELVTRKLHLAPVHTEPANGHVRFPLVPASGSHFIDAVGEDVLDFLDPA